MAAANTSAAVSNSHFSSKVNKSLYLSTISSTSLSFSKSPVFTFKSLSITPASAFPTLSPVKSSAALSDFSLINATSSAPLSSTSSPGSLKSRLHNGETLYGLFLLSFSPTFAEIAGLAGYDFVVVDMEHGHGGIAEALPCLHALAANGTPAIIRVPETCPTWAKKALDLGPQGIMFPMIESAKAAKKAVSYCHFPPRGIRGSAHTIVRASKYGINEGYLSNYEEELLIMCQIESEEGVKKVEDIAKVDGVDCIQMGPLDLSASMGYLWDPGNKKVKEMMRTAEKAILGVGAPGTISKKSNHSGVYLGGFAMPHDGPIDMKTRGYRMVSGAVDLGLFRSAAVEDVKRFKASLVDMSNDDDDEERDTVVEEKYWSE